MHGIPIQTAVSGRERCDSGDIPRHRHASGYVTLVLGGGYIEAGDAGRFKVREGDVLIYRPFEAHQDFFAGIPAQLLNLPLTSQEPEAGMVRVADPDAVARLAETDLHAATLLLCSQAQAARAEEDWPDLLAAALRKPSPLRIGDWARRHGLAPATISRGFQQVFGTTPARYRAEARTRAAWRATLSTDRPLAELAFELGFADQAHMTRSLTSLTGVPPQRWRAQHQMNSRPEITNHLA